MPQMPAAAAARCGASSGHARCRQQQRAQPRGALGAWLPLCLLLCLAAAAGPRAAAQAVAVSGAATASLQAALSAPAPEERFSMIIVLRDAASLARLRAMCAPSTLLFRLWMRKMGLKADCQMPPAVCRRIYSETIIGAGRAGGRVGGEAGSWRGLGGGITRAILG